MTDIEKVTVPEKHFYKCPECGTSYDSKEKAEECANFKVPEHKYQVGDVFRLSNWDSDSHQYKYHRIITLLTLSDYGVDRCTYKVPGYRLSGCSSGGMTEKVIENQISSGLGKFIRTARKSEQRYEKLKAKLDSIDRIKYDIEFNSRTGQWEAEVTLA